MKKETVPRTARQKEEITNSLPEGHSIIAKSKTRRRKIQDTPADLPILAIENGRNSTLKILTPKGISRKYFTDIILAGVRLMLNGEKVSKNLWPKSTCSDSVLKDKLPH